MKLIKWTGIIAAVVLVIACFMPWVSIPSKSITISGVQTEGTSFGKPAYFHFISVFFFLLFIAISRLWSVRANLVVAALNLAWAIRNFLIISMCRGGECPEKKLALYLVAAGSIIMLVAALFPDTKLRPAKS